MDYSKRVPDHSVKPNPNKVNDVIGWIANATIPITPKNFREWLVKLAYEASDGAAACSNGHDHGCNRGLGEYLGIEPYGQGVDGNVPWFKQQGFSSERLNRYVDPAWQAIICIAPFELQKKMYIDLLTEMRDAGTFNYDVSRYIVFRDSAPAQAAA